MTPILNVALIGCGYWGKNLARIISEHQYAKLYLLCDTNIEQARALQTIYFDSKVETDYETVLLDSNIDAVIVSTPVSTHYQIVKDALKNGKHVLCEKVLSTSVDEVRALINEAQTNGLALVVGHTFLYNTIVKHIKTAIERGDLGELLYLTFKRTGLGPIRSDVDVISDLAAHDLSILYYWLGKPNSCLATSRNFLTSQKADIAFIHCEYTDGPIVDLQLSWLSPMKQRIIEVVGTKQMMVFDDVSTTEKLKIIKTGRDYQSQVRDFGSFQLSVKDGDIIIPSIPYPEPLREEFDDFIFTIRSKSTSHNTHDAAICVAECIESLK